MNGGTENGGNEDAILLNLAARNYVLKAVATDNSDTSTTSGMRITVGNWVVSTNRFEDQDAI